MIQVFWIEDSIRLAKGHYDSATNTVKFVITKEPASVRNIEASKSFYVAVNRDIVKETSTITPTISIGNTLKQFSVPVRYNQIPIVLRQMQLMDLQFLV